MNTKMAGGNVLVTPAIFSKLLLGQVVKAQDLNIPNDFDSVQISCDNVQIGICSITEENRLLLSEIMCPVIMHYNKSPFKIKSDDACPLCGGARGVPTLLNTSDRHGQMVCALAIKFGIYRKIALPAIDDSYKQATGDAALVALFSLLCGE